MKKIGTPRIPKKDGVIRFQYGRNDGECDFLVLWSNGVPKCDTRLVMNAFTSKRLSLDYSNASGVSFDDSFIDELEKRGYDTTTIKFSIEKKRKMDD